MTHFMAIDKKQPADGPGSHWPCSGKEYRPSFEIWVICDLSQECLTLKNIHRVTQNGPLKLYLLALCILCLIKNIGCLKLLRVN